MQYSSISQGTLYPALHGNRIAGSIIVHELTIFVIFEDS